VQNWRAGDAGLESIDYLRRRFLCRQHECNAAPAAHRAEVAVQWNIIPWRLNMLKTAPTAGMALDDAADADLIVFAIRRFPRPNGWLMHWLNQWFSHRLTPETTLAIICEAATVPAFVQISQFARQKGLDFIFNNYGEGGDKTNFPALEALLKQETLAVA
jgi:hypothetical protein